MCVRHICVCAPMIEEHPLNEKRTSNMMIMHAVAVMKNGRHRPRAAFYLKTILCFLKRGGDITCRPDVS